MIISFHLVGILIGFLFGHLESKRAEKEWLKDADRELPVEIWVSEVREKSIYVAHVLDCILGQLIDEGLPIINLKGCSKKIPLVLIADGLFPVNRIDGMPKSLLGKIWRDSVNKGGFTINVIQTEDLIQIYDKDLQTITKRIDNLKKRGLKNIQNVNGENNVLR